MKFGNIVQVETSRYLAKITTLQRPIAARSKVLAAKHTASLQLLCTVGGNQARLDARPNLIREIFKGVWEVNTEVQAFQVEQRIWIALHLLA
jgi:hypothetical protein